MENMKMAFQTLPKDEKPPSGFQYVNCHIAFNIKMDDFVEWHA